MARGMGVGSRGVVAWVPQPPSGAHAGARLRRAWACHPAGRSVRRTGLETLKMYEARGGLCVVASGRYDRGLRERCVFSVLGIVGAVLCRGSSRGQACSYR